MIEHNKPQFTQSAREIRRRKEARQVAALCYRKTRSGKKVLLITSRGTGRWIVPKGWPIKGLADPQAALQEAWEEAGVTSADVTTTPIGHYEYDKWHRGGDVTPVQTQVYLAKVETLADSYPEDHQRERKWFTPAKAATLVQEPQLKEILQSI
ncbi:MAG: NUDIX hydrolase [Sedimentitalea sp.]|uniref:NUDIX hydrolase n=1 Tax=Rhodobacterales TaxID=204455 RepID=UPI0032987BA5